LPLPAYPASRRGLIKGAAALAVLTATRGNAGAVEAAEARHAIAMYGEPELAADFAHFPYANPAAPKGGRLTLGFQGSFDSLNLLAVGKNSPPVLIPYVLQSLMFRTLDEPFTLYPLLAESIATPKDRSYAEFRLNPQARFSDGRPVTAEDVIFSWDLLRRRSHPFRRGYYGKVRTAEALDARTVRFTFGDKADYELPLILGLMPVLARHATDPEKFDQMGFTPLLGSGPYKVAEVQPGNRVVLTRDPAFWGADLPTLRGFYNVDELRFEYFRDGNTFIEAFRTGVYDFRVELDPTRWATAYDSPALHEGRFVKEGYRFLSPRPLNAFIMNSRRRPFADVRARRAMTLLFDFEWLNRNLFRGLYRRTASFFDESELAARGHPASARERALLAPFAADIPAEVMDGTWAPPVTDGSGRDRVVMGKAVDLFASAGWRIRDGAMTDATGERRYSFDIMVNSRDKERVALAFADTLRLIGIAARIRLVDDSQYWSRLRTFDYDMVIETYASSASPGNEQENRWSSAAADRQASLNYAGVRSGAVDAAIAAMLAARDKDEYISAVRALDRALIAGAYVIPLYHAPERWVARWTRIARPDRMPRFDFSPDVWWRNEP
jgi:peptide/nickel transport system substrate-binding protein